MSAPTDVTALLELESIKALKYAYARCLDQKLWDEIEMLFVPVGATAAYSGGKYRYEGRTAIVEFLRTNMGRDSFHTSHRMHHPEIRLLDGGHATAVWAFDDVNVDAELDFILMGAGFYDDHYRKIDGTWLIESTGYRRTFETIRALSGGRSAVTASWWSTDGRSSLEVQ